MSAPVYDRHGVQVHHGDCLDVLRTLPDASVHALVTDPPAGIRFMGRVWDSDMGGRHSWVAWLSERMREAHRVLKPGGYGLVWALPRTSHWTAWALEDAGFEVRDCIVHLFGSGFPKSLDVGKAIDKAAGDSPVVRGWALRQARMHAGLTKEQVATAIGCRPQSVTDWEDGRARTTGGPREVCIPSPEYREKLASLLGYAREAERETTSAARRPATGRDGYGFGEDFAVTAPATDAARQWDGFGTALKPAAEHWWLIRKPMPGTVAATVLEHGTGALNIDGCRTAAGQDYLDKCASVVGLDSNRNGAAYGDWTGSRTDSAHAGGRWPSNLVLTHAARCDDNGCQPDWCPVAELDGQSGIQRDGVAVNRNRNPGTATSWYGTRDSQTGGDVGYGGEGDASRFFPQFRWEAKAPTSERPVVNGKAHETVKPLGLMRWMVRLVCAPGGTVLDCFAGSGTTGQAARAEGMRAVLIEQDADHIDKIRARLDARPKTTAAEATAVADEPMDLLDLLDGTAS